MPGPRRARRGRRIRHDGADRSPCRARAADEARQARRLRALAASRPAGCADRRGRRIPDNGRRAGATMIALTDIRYVRLGTRDIDAATQYATSILGLERGPREG